MILGFQTGCGNAPGFFLLYIVDKQLSHESVHCQ